MKKIFLSLVFLFGVGTFVMADDTMKVKNDLKSATIIQYTIKGRFMSR